MTVTADETVLRSLVGDGTLRRAESYARSGAVLRTRRSGPEGPILGTVRGSRRSPYSAVAVVSRGRRGELLSFRGTCSCPVGDNCKHAVALVLVDGGGVDGGGVGGGGVDGGGGAAGASWERTLAPFAADGPVWLDPTTTQVALQFQVGAAHDGVRLAVRPVLPGRNGGWVRTGIGWWDLDRPGYSRSPLRPEHRRLLQEIRGMDDSGSHYYGYGRSVIALENVASRRVWDLLREARDSGVPLVQPGQPPGAVMLADDPATAALEVERSGGDLVLHAEVRSGGQALAADSYLLIGNPAHGVAWWESPGRAGSGRHGPLLLAPFAAPLTDELHLLLGRAAVTVPAADEQRFFGGIYPRLRRRVPLVSPDGSVDLPEPAMPVLALRVEHRDGAVAHLTWQWRYPAGDGVLALPLWPDSEQAVSRESAYEAAVLRHVGRAVGSMAALRESRADGGSRLVESAALRGYDTVRFVAEVLPGLTEVDGVAVETVGTCPDFRPAPAPPLVEVDGAPDRADRDWFDLAVTVSVAGEPVPFQELFVALSQGQTHLVLASGVYLDLDQPELRALAELIAEARALQDAEPSGGVRLSRYQADLWAELESLAVVRGQAADWHRSARALAEVAELSADTEPPAGLRAQLRPYQRAGFSWLAFLYDNGLGGVLADDMGLGKTLQAIALMCHAAETGRARAPFLVVAPTSVVPNWAAECRRFAPSLRVVAVTETAPRRGQSLVEAVAAADVVVTSYTLFRLEHDDYLGLDWSGLVLDEAQFVKNHQTRAYRCARTLPTPFKLAITGTPMENHLMELWSLLSITAPGLFPTPRAFEEHYRTPIERHGDSDRLARLRRRVRPLLVRRTKEQVLADLPAKQEQVMELELNPRHRRVYQTHLQRERQKVLGLLDDLDGNRFEIFRSLTLLRQASLDVGLVDPAHTAIPSTKLDLLVEQVTEVAREGHRTLVFSQFTRFLDLARRRLEAAGLGCCYLDGSTRNRAEVIAEFKTGTAPVFLISLKAGGFGLNLTEADYCIVLDPWWNPAAEAQAVDRLHRIGQRRNVMVYRLVATGTIEEKVMALKAKKAALFRSVMDDDAQFSRSLTAEDIRGLFD